MIISRFLYKLHQDHGFTWTEGILQVGLNDEEKAAVDKVTLEELIMVVRQEGAAKVVELSVTLYMSPRPHGFKPVCKKRGGS